MLDYLNRIAVCEAQVKDRTGREPMPTLEIRNYRLRKTGSNGQDWVSDVAGGSGEKSTDVPYEFLKKHITEFQAK